MVNYILLYKNEKTNVSYYYNLDDHFVYTNGKSIDNKKINKFSFIGATIVILIYPTIYLAKTWSLKMSILSGVLFSFIGFLLGWIVSLILLRSINTYFVEENKLEMSKEKIKQMYLDGNLYRKKYMFIFISFSLFTIISTIVLCYTNINIVLLLMIIVLWMIVGIMTFMYRYVCSKKIKL